VYSIEIGLSWIWKEGSASKTKNTYFKLQRIPKIMLKFLQIIGFAAASRVIAV
jgi:hypothetical protein